MTDPGGLRWVGVIAYALVAALAYRRSGSSARRERAFWLAAAVMLVMLGAAKGLHLQDDVTGALRSAAKAGGWYSWHSEVQLLFAALVGIALLSAAFVAAQWLRDCSSRAIAGAAILFLLLGFVLIRAASIHQMDSWAMHVVAGLRRGWWVEIAALTILGALAAMRPGPARDRVEPA